MINHVFDYRISMYHIKIKQIVAAYLLFITRIYIIDRYNIFIIIIRPRYILKLIFLLLFFFFLYFIVKSYKDEGTHEQFFYKYIS